MMDLNIWRLKGFQAHRERLGGTKPHRPHNTTREPTQLALAARVAAPAPNKPSAPAADPVVHAMGDLATEQLALPGAPVGPGGASIAIMPPALPTKRPPTHRRRPSCEEAPDARRPPPIPPPRGLRPGSGGDGKKALPEARQRAEDHRATHQAADCAVNPMLHIASTGYGMRVEYGVPAPTCDEVAVGQPERRDLRASIDGMCVLSCTNGAVQWCRASADSPQSASSVDPYSELGVCTEASDAEIRRGYLELARDCQPSRGDTEVEAAGRAQQLELLSGCFTILTSPLLREQFDRGEFELTRLADDRKDELDTDWWEDCEGGDADDVEQPSSAEREPEWAREIYEWTARWKEAHFAHTGVAPPRVRVPSPEQVR